MMFKYTFVSLMILSACAYAQADKGRLVVNTTQNASGQLIKMSYEPANLKFSDQKPVKAAIYQYADRKWHTDSLTMVKEQGTYGASYPLLSNTAFWAVKFYQGSLRAPDISDNNAEHGYAMAVTNKKGKRLPGGALGMALFKLPPQKGGLPNYFQSRDIKISNDSLKLLLDEELRGSKGTPKTFITPYFDILFVIKGEEFKNDAPAMLDELLKRKDLSEQDLSEIYRIYNSQVKDRNKAEGVRERLLAHFPRGEFARMDAYQRFLKEADKKDLVIKNGDQFLKDFPPGTGKENNYRRAFIYYTIYRNLSAAYFENKDYEVLQKLRKGWDFKTENEIYRWNVVRAYVSGSVPAEKLQPLADSLFHDLHRKLSDSSYRFDFDTKDQFQANALDQFNLRIADQINIHYLNKDYVGALKLYETFPPEKRYASAELNEIHMHLLDRTGRIEELQQVLELSARNNSVTPAMFDRLKQLYISKNSGTAGYEKYLASLRSDEEISKLKAYVNKHMINQEIMPFAMEDMNGKIVRSSDWEGKIVVLDFWATWCRPCIEAFPGMQMAVDKYAADKKVDFYFIGTMQFGDYKQKVKDFITREGWRFKVLHDGVNERTGQQNAVFSTIAPIFSSSGIPRKVILKDGLMRYTTEGYSGSPSQLADEISYAIELLKAEK